MAAALGPTSASLQPKGAPFGQAFGWSAYLVGLIALIVVPLPPLVLDVLVALNLLAAFLLLMSTFFASSFVSLSTFPTVLLLTTVARLAASVATCRAVLSGSDPGAIVRSFGDFVAGGSLAVGVTIFLVISVVQFLVITKGAERIAEVSARFLLDALPGRQVSIEADARAGRIDAAEAATRRDALREESQLMGALEGAMRFVKGDSLATLVIVALNLVGGLLIAMLERNETLAGAGRHYLTVSIGDGLVAQLPSMLSAFAAGTLATRAGARSADVGAKIFTEMNASDGALLISAAVIACMGFLPGFPLPVMLAIGAVAAAPVLVRRWRRAAAAISPEDQPTREEAAKPAPFLGEAHYSDPFVCVLHPRTFAAMKRADYENVMRQRRKDTVRHVGAPLPILAFTTDPSREEGVLSVRFEGVERTRLTFASEADLNAVVEALEEMIVDYYSANLTIDDAREWLDDAEKRYPSLGAIVRQMDPSLFSDCIRRLMQEGVSLAHPRPILEAFSALQRNDVTAIDEYVQAARSALREQISSRLREKPDMVLARVPASLLEKAATLASTDMSIDRTAFNDREALFVELAEGLRTVIAQTRARGLVAPSALRHRFGDIALEHRLGAKIFSEEETSGLTVV